MGWQEKRVVVRACSFFTPQGWAALAATDCGLFACAWPLENIGEGIAFLRKAVFKKREAVLVVSSLQEVRKSDLLGQAAAELLLFLVSGKVSKPLEGFPVDWSWFTNWQKNVYKVVRSIPPGEVRSYRWVAEQCGRPRAARAVGRALAANPLPLFIPCHRVVYAGGSLGNYGCGGEWLKRHLLALEGYKGVFAEEGKTFGGDET
ncbi:MAG: Methylated-DNA-[protein]-cysteine S-methyltransferase Ogt [Thermoanaerobacterales bacterium 50_218]|nr:MAG: Methylated-DNA-[protein]-cysteine S-methyltransferase Ogt [Thermoanaerobacterales bacterium 50_218]